MLKRKKAKLKKTVARPKIKKTSHPSIATVYETTAGAEKYPSFPAKLPLRQTPAELPSGYGEDKITLLARDPRWVYAYWETTPFGLDRARREVGEEFNHARMALRVYDVTGIKFTGSNARGFFDISINEYANSWYIETAKAGRTFCVDLGYLLPSGRFVIIARSNAVYTPIEGPSSVTDEEWLVPEERFAWMYGMGFGLGKSSPVGRAWQERIGIASMASPVKKIPKEKENHPIYTFSDSAIIIV